MFRHPHLGIASTDFGKIKPKAATTITSGDVASSNAWISGFLSEIGFAIARPLLPAASATGLDASFMPLPAGRSGWVNTKAMSCPASCSASSARTAKGGVPAKTTRKSLAYAALR